MRHDGNPPWSVCPSPPFAALLSSGRGDLRGLLREKLEWTFCDDDDVPAILREALTPDRICEAAGKAELVKKRWTSVTCASPPARLPIGFDVLTNSISRK
jgi:hypothetical protein